MGSEDQMCVVLNGNDVAFIYLDLSPSLFSSWPNKELSVKREPRPSWRTHHKASNPGTKHVVEIRCAH